MRHVVIRTCPICPARRAVAERVAAELGRVPDVRAEITRGGLGELSVTVDGRSAFRSWGILIAPSAKKVLRQVEALLSA